MRIAARLGVAGLAVMACLAVGAPVAQAWVRTVKAAGDPLTTWTLTPNAVTIRSTNPVLLKFVRGHAVLGCGTTPKVVVRGEDASSITFRPRVRLPRNLGICDADEVGHVPGFLFATTFSRAPFSSVWRKRLASTPPPGQLLAGAQLLDYWTGLSLLVPGRYLNRVGDVIRLPPAAALVRHAKRVLIPLGDRMLYAPTLAGVTVPGVVYAIGKGWGRKRLEFAVIGLDGRRYVLRARLGSRPKVGPG